MSEMRTVRLTRPSRTNEDVPRPNSGARGGTDADLPCPERPVDVHTFVDEKQLQEPIRMNWAADFAAQRLSESAADRTRLANTFAAKAKRRSTSLRHKLCTALEGSAQRVSQPRLNNTCHG